MKPTTLRAIHNELELARAQFPDNTNLLRELRNRATDLEPLFGAHTLGHRHTRATDVYVACLQIAVLAIRLLEEGDKKYIYAQAITANKQPSNVEWPKSENENG